MNDWWLRYMIDIDDNNIMTVIVDKDITIVDGNYSDIIDDMIMIVITVYAIMTNVETFPSPK